MVTNGILVNTGKKRNSQINPYFELTKDDIMNISTLSNTICTYTANDKIFINAFLDEDYDYMIASLSNEIYLNEAEGSDEPSKIAKFLAWIKKNAWHKPRAWFANILTKLNGFAAKIRHAEETRPGERSIWSKIKSAVAKVIVWVTNKIENFVRPDKIGDEENDNGMSLSTKDVNDIITFSKKEISQSRPNSQKRAWIRNKYITNAAIDNDLKKLDKVDRYEHKRDQRHLKNEMKRAFDAIKQTSEKSMRDKGLDPNKVNEYELNVNGNPEENRKKVKELLNDPNGVLVL